MTWQGRPESMAAKDIARETGRRRAWRCKVVGRHDMAGQAEEHGCKGQRKGDRQKKSLAVQGGGKA